MKPEKVMIMKLIRLFIFISLFLLCTASFALQIENFSQSSKLNIRDTVRLTAKDVRGQAGKSFQKEFSYMGIPFVMSGLFVKKQNQDFRTLRNRFKPSFHSHYDDYIQYAPLAATWGLKLAGVQSRSSWKELAVSNVFSAALMAGAVNTLKYTTKENRPDNSSNNSFPSGHTATAFMCATILHKEYGALSPWYSIGGYTLAGMTGVMRQLNNRHWIGDVLVGAGIGMIATDLGYFFSDLIYKPQFNMPLSGEDMRYAAPSFLSFNMGISSGPSYLKTPEIYDSENGSPLGMRLKVGTATVVSVEGAYFFNAYWGIGGRLKVATLPVIADISKESMALFDMDSDLQKGAPVNMFLLEGLSSDHLGMFDADFGLYFSYPLNNQFRIGTKLLVGRRLIANFSLNSVSRVNPQIFNRQIVSETAYNQFYKEDVDSYVYQDGLSQEEFLKGHYVDDEFLTISKSFTRKIGTGLSLSYRYKDDASFRLYCDYDFAAPRLKYDLKNSWIDENGIRPFQSYTSKTSMHNFTFGASIAFVFLK